MKRATRPSVGKLLRVLVAGGVALAGAEPRAALAEEQKTDKAATDKAAADKKQAEADAAKKKSDGKDKEKDKEKKAEEAGGVKGW